MVAVLFSWNFVARRTFRLAPSRWLTGKSPGFDPGWMDRISPFGWRVKRPPSDHTKWHMSMF